MLNDVDMMHKFTLYDIEQVAETLLLLAEGKKVIAFKGDMGVGKTTFIHTVCRCLGVKEAMSSPSFPIINEYNTTDGKLIYHIDAYRLNSLSEAINAGIEETLYSGEYCFIEWPQNVEALLPDDIFEVSLEKVSETKRKLIAKVANAHIKLKS